MSGYAASVPSVSGSGQVTLATQRVTLAGDDPASAISAEFSTQILVELRVISRLLAEGLSVSDSIESMRNDELAGLGL